MDANGMQSIRSSNGYLGVKIPFQNQQQEQWSHHNHQPGFHQQEDIFFQNDIQSFQSPANGKNFPHLTRSNQQLMAIDNEKPQFNVEDGDNVDGGTLASSSIPYQRIKWTNEMVRLLIVVVYIVDYHNYENNDPSSRNKIKTGRRFLQKKGKWECVSSAMVEKGFLVSSNQCEDKFNDLNKKYKAVVDILGKGTACKVVENPSLLDSMDHLSAEMKKEVSKLLNSKQLFFEDMCAYHNSGVGCSSVSNHDKCTKKSKIAHKLNRIDDANGNHGVEYNSEDTKDVEEIMRGSKWEEYDGLNSNKMEKVDMDCSQTLQELRKEVMTVFQDGNRTYWEKTHWHQKKLLELEELQVKYQAEALRILKYRMSWKNFRTRIDKEIENKRHELERKKLQNDNMLLLLRQKECELMESEQQQGGTQMLEFPPMHD